MSYDKPSHNLMLYRFLFWFMFYYNNVTVLALQFGPPLFGFIRITPTSLLLPMWIMYTTCSVSLNSSRPLLSYSFHKHSTHILRTEALIWFVYLQDPGFTAMVYWNGNKSFHKSRISLYKRATIFAEFIEGWNRSTFYLIHSHLLIWSKGFRISSMSFFRDVSS